MNQLKNGNDDAKSSVLKKDLKQRVWEAFSLCEQFEIDLIVDTFKARFISGYVK